MPIRVYVHRDTVHVSLLKFVLFLYLCMFAAAPAFLGAAQARAQGDGVAGSFRKRFPLFQYEY